MPNEPQRSAPAPDHGKTLVPESPPILDSTKSDPLLTPPTPVSPPSASASSPYPEYSFLAAPEHPNELGRLGGYRILRVLGKGGMGMVFVAIDESLDRKVALKIMLPSVASRPQARERFKREARSAASVEHDNVIKIYQVGEDRGVPFLVMPLLKGETLEDRLRHPPLPLSVEEVVRISREIARGLGAAHEKNLIHRDVKPGNVWLEANTGGVKLLDFGIARAADGAHGLTRTGQFIGTPGYMAPEQAMADNIDHRADLFSLGCIMYEMIAGKQPFSQASAIAFLGNLPSPMPPAPDVLNPAIPKELSDLILSLISRNADERPGSSTEVILALNRISPPTVFNTTGSGVVRTGEGQLGPTGTVPGSKIDFVIPTPINDAEKEVDPFAATKTGERPISLISPPPPPTKPGPKKALPTPFTEPVPKGPSKSDAFSEDPPSGPNKVLWAIIAAAIALVLGIVSIGIAVVIIFDPFKSKTITPTTKETVPTIDPGRTEVVTPVVPIVEKPEPYADRNSLFPPVYFVVTSGAEKALFTDEELLNEALKLISNPQSSTKGLTDLRKLAEKGYPPALFRLADYMMYGYGVVPHDRVTALATLKKAASLNYSPAEATLAYFQLQFGGRKIDPAEVRARFARSRADLAKTANGGDVIAQYALGILLRWGTDQEPNLQDAEKWLKQSADRGFASADVQLASLSESGSLRGQPNLSEAYFRWLEAAKKGNAAGEWHVARCLAEGRGTAVDPAAALGWARKSLAQRYSEPLADPCVLMIPPTRPSLPWFTVLADAGLSDASYLIGRMHDFGIGATIDPRKAAQFYKQAMGQNHPLATATYSLLQWEGAGIPKNPDQAIARLTSLIPEVTELANQDNASAAFILGWMYSDGRGMKVDQAKGLEWYRKASELGDLPAMNRFGREVFNSKSTSDAEKKEGISWWKKAAEAGLPSAQLNMGRLSLNREPKDIEYGLKMLMAAAEAGHSMAMTELGKLYREGRDIPSDEALSKKWYERAKPILEVAADNGSSLSMHTLGEMYENGYGVMKSLETARSWYKKAADENYLPSRKALERLGPP